MYAPGGAAPITPPGGPAPITYKEIFIDTYDPLDPTGASGALHSNYMELWSSDGKTRLAFYDGINDLRPVNGGYAFIDYTGGLISGDYWVFINESGGGSDQFGYGVRVLSAASSVYTGWTFTGSSPDTTSDQPLTSGGGSPSTYRTIVFSNSTNDRLYREIFPSGVNWVKITLP